MEGKQQFDIWKEDLTAVLESKVEEFHLFGYDRVTAEDIWNCAIAQYKKEKEYIRFHQFVNTILSLKPQAYMKWVTMQSYKNPINYFEVNEDEVN